MPQFRKKPVVIEAIQWTGENEAAITEWTRREGNFRPGVKQKVTPDGEKALNFLSIPTLEGAMEAMPGDWIIRGVKGEFYPCRADIFEATYEPA